MWRRLPVLLVVGAVALTGCGGSSPAAGPSASVTAPPSTERTTTTEALTPEQQVEAAYLRSWDVYAKAVRELDPSGLEESYAGEQLDVTRREVERRVRERRPSHVSVEHRYSITIVRPDLAVVRDLYKNHSVLLDPSTGKPTEADPNETILDAYTLKLIEGTWKVVRILREQ